MRDLFLFLSHDDGVIYLLGYCNKTLVFAELCTSCTCLIFVIKIMFSYKKNEKRWGNNIMANNPGKTHHELDR